MADDLLQITDPTQGPTDQQLLQKQPPKPPPQKRVKPWHEIALTLDPMMPKAEFDQRRDHYFNQYIGRYTHPDKVIAARADFMAKTERAPLLTTGEKMFLGPNLMATQLIHTLSHEMVEPAVGYVSPRAGNYLKKEGQKDEDYLQSLHALAKREGLETTEGVSEAAGNLGAAAAELESLGKVMEIPGAIARGFGLLATATKTAKGIELANRVLKGGPTFGIYEGLHDEKGLGHSFLDGTFERGMLEGRLWEFASVGGRIKRVVKGAVVGDVLGQMHEQDDSKKGYSGFVGGAMGAVFGLLPAGAEEEHPRDQVLKQALTPDVSKPLPEMVDQTLAKTTVDSVKKSVREMKPKDLTVDESLRGVKVRMTDAKGTPVEIAVLPFAEARALDAVNRLALEGGSVEGIDYSTTHGDTAQRFLKMSETWKSHSPEVETRVVQQQKKFVEAEPKAVVDDLYTGVREHDIILNTHKNLPKTSELYPELVDAKKGIKTFNSQIGEKKSWLINRLRESEPERQFLDHNLTGLINNRNLSVTNKTVNEQIKALAYKPELRVLIPPQFRDVFDTAVLQQPKDATFANSRFQFAAQYKKLEAVAPLRSPTELMEMSKILAQIEKGRPNWVAKDQQERAQLLRHQQGYDQAFQESLKYPEIGKSLPVGQQIAWNAMRKPEVEAEAKRVKEHESQLLIRPKSKIEFKYETGSAETVMSGETNRMINDQARELALRRQEEARQRLADKAARNVEEARRWADYRLGQGIDYEPDGRPIDVPTLPEMEDLEPNEIDEVMRQEIEEKGRGIEAPGVMEEFLRTGQWEKKDATKTFAATAKVPAGETTRLKMGETAKIEEGVLKVYVPEHMLHRMNAGAMYKPEGILETLNELGYKDHPDEIWDYALSAQEAGRVQDPSTGMLQARPPAGMILLPIEEPVEHEFHELVHNALDYVSGLEGVYPEKFGLGDAHTKTLDQVAKAFARLPSYSTATKGMLNEEAFVHAATALVKRDNQTLYGLGMVDTSVDRVVSMVHDMSGRFLKKLTSRPDWQELRAVKDRLGYINKIASPEVSYSLRQASDRLNLMFTTPEGRFRLTEDNGTEHTFDNKIDAFHFMMGYDTTPQAPSWTMVLEQLGVRTDSDTLSRFSPARNGGPTYAPDESSDGWKGLMAVSDLARPMGQWVAKAQSKLNEHWDGFQKIGLLDAFKGVDDAFRNSTSYVEQQRKVFAEDLKHFSTEKLHDVFAFLSKETRFWPSMKAKYNMSEEDMIHVTNLDRNLRNLDATNHIGVYNYFIREMPLLERNQWSPEGVLPTLKDPKQASTFYRGILEGRFKPEDTHAGRFINFALQASQEGILEPSIRELKGVINTKDKDGGYVLGALRGPMERYINYMTNRPDVSSKLMKGAVAGLQENMTTQFKKINKYLPSKLKLPEEFDYPGSAINKLMALSYVSGLGIRASVFIRDTLQVVTNAMPVMGMKNFATGASKALSPKGWAQAEAAGALLHQGNVGELYGDIFNEIPVGGRGRLDKAVEMSSKLLWPSRFGHNIGRSIVYHGIMDASQKATQDLRAGRISVDKFLGDTATWFLDKSERDRYVSRALSPEHDTKDVSREIALDMVDRTLWAYRRGQQPGLLRTGAGRVFGQYGMWPLNYQEYLRTLAARSIEGGAVSKYAIKAAAVFLGTSLAAYETMDKGLGIDAGKWLFLSPSGYAGGPALEMLLNAYKAPEESPEGLKARKQLLESPIGFVPAGNQITSTLETINDPKYWDLESNTPTPEGWVKLAGFRPVNPKDEMLDQVFEGTKTPEQFLRKESGFKPGKGDILGNPR